MADETKDSKPKTSSKKIGKVDIQRRIVVKGKRDAWAVAKIMENKIDNEPRTMAQWEKTLKEVLKGFNYTLSK